MRFQTPRVHRTVRAGHNLTYQSRGDYQVDYLTVEHNTGIDLRDEFILVGRESKLDNKVISWICTASVTIEILQKQQKICQRVLKHGDDIIIVAKPMQKRLPNCVPISYLSPVIEHSTHVSTAAWLNQKFARKQQQNA